MCVGRRLDWLRRLEEEDNKIVKWAQEDVEILCNLLNNNNNNNNNNMRVFIFKWSIPVGVMQGAGIKWYGIKNSFVYLRIFTFYTTSLRNTSHVKDSER